jgi:nitrogen fixation-related uncharacterized protein
MLSSKSWILFGIIALVAVVVIWKFWKKPTSKSYESLDEPQKQILDSKDNPPPETSEQIEQSQQSQQPPPMVFAVNDQGNFDLTDISGNLLNIGFGPNPKTYINLLDQAERDVSRDDTTGQIISTVGNTKSYEIAGKRYIVNFTRLV